MGEAGFEDVESSMMIGCGYCLRLPMIGHLSVDVLLSRGEDYLSVKNGASIYIAQSWALGPHDRLSG